VRLKGFDWSLEAQQPLHSCQCCKRPANIHWLETLQVFGIEAEFMQRFRDYLAEEGLPGNERKEVIEHADAHNAGLRQAAESAPAQAEEGQRQGIRLQA
jgi:hypothetical protein